MYCNIIYGKRFEGKLSRFLWFFTESWIFEGKLLRFLWFFTELWMFEGKFSRFLWFFTESWIFSHELWPVDWQCKSTSMLPQNFSHEWQFCTLTAEVFPHKSFAVYSICYTYVYVPGMYWLCTINVYVHTYIHIATYYGHTFSTTCNCNSKQCVVVIS